MISCQAGIGDNSDAQFYSITVTLKTVEYSGAGCLSSYIDFQGVSFSFSLSQRLVNNAKTTILTDF